MARDATRDLPPRRAAGRPEPPDDLPVAAAQRTLRAGCHLLDLTRAGSRPEQAGTRYVGTLRIDRAEGSVMASGDLYLHETIACGRPEQPDPRAGIPVFARERFRDYVRVTELDERSADADVALAFELHRYDEPSNGWTREGPFSALLTWSASPAAYPSAEDFLAGELLEATGRSAGSLTIGWLSPFVRRAVVEIGGVRECERPLANTARLDWRAFFDEVGWDVAVVESDADLLEPEGGTWSVADLHAALCARRSGAGLDAEWRYRLLCVRYLETGERGLMFDDRAGDSDNIPREGAAIASHWVIPESEAWGTVRGMRFGEATDPYFRTALHEIGHATSLYHGGTNNIMTPTEQIGGRTFPQNMVWSHRSGDRQRLRHLPDVWVRPGGIPFGSGHDTAPELPSDAIAKLDGLQLDVVPLLDAVPIGAPVRVAIALRNAREQDIAAPADLSLKGGQVSGTVTDPSGAVRSFRSLLRRLEPHALTTLAPGAARSGAMTLLRGRDGALFPMAGPHVIQVHVTWTIAGALTRATGTATLTVAPAVEGRHADAARRVIDTPDVFLTLVLGGDHLEEGIGAVRAALDTDELRPHFAYVEARRLASPFGDRLPDLAGAADLIDPETVMSAGEVDKATRLIQASHEQGERAPDRLLRALHEKARHIDVPRALDRLARL